MNAAHLHLLLNHIPVIGIPIIGVLLVLAVAVKQQALVRIALGFTVVLALFTVPVYLSGEPAEEIVEDLPGVPHAVLEEHEEIAKVTFVATEVLGALALLGLALAWKRGRVPKPLAYGSLVLVLIASGLLARTAYLGGQIRHTEIRETLQLLPSQEEDMDEHTSAGQRSLTEVEAVSLYKEGNGNSLQRMKLLHNEAIGS